MASRRIFLLSGAAAVLAGGAGGLWAVEHDVLPGRVPLGRALGRCDVDATASAGTPGPVTGGSFASRFRRRTVGWALALPPGSSARGLPVALVLPGRGGSARDGLGSLGLPRFLAQHVQSGGRPFALAAIDGGAAYWHPRADGDDPLGMLVHEFLPRLVAMGLPVGRVAVMGWSMGGYGALLLARQSGRDALAGSRVVAAAASAPALFTSFGSTAAGAFDSEADFAAWGDLVRDPAVPAGLRLYVACGDTDPFAGPTRRYRQAVEPVPAGGISQGCHDAGFFRTQVAAQLGLIGTELDAA